MSDDLVERVAKAMRDVYLARQPKYSGAEGYPLEEFLPEADAAIAVVLEEAAKVAENASFQFTQTHPSTVEVVDVRHTIAAAIRALIKEPSND